MLPIHSQVVTEKDPKILREKYFRVLLHIAQV